MAIEQYNVKSLDQFVKLVGDIRHTWTKADRRFFNPWFRGHMDVTWGLVPGIYRNDDFKGREANMRASFKRQGSLLITERLPASDWEWYFLMQHYGAPTRLLDWSDGALIALFFALSPYRAGSPDVRTDAAVWMLAPRWLNEQVLGKAIVITIGENKEVTDEYLPPDYGNTQAIFPIAISPQNIYRRIGSQRSRFTIHGIKEEGLLEIGKRGENSRLAMIRIKKSAIHRMRIDLATCGIWDTTIFPDLDGLSREIIRDHTDYWA